MKSLYTLLNEKFAFKPTMSNEEIYYQHSTHIDEISFDLLVKVERYGVINTILGEVKIAEQFIANYYIKFENIKRYSILTGDTQRINLFDKYLLNCRISPPLGFLKLDLDKTVDVEIEYSNFINPKNNYNERIKANAVVLYLDNSIYADWAKQHLSNILL